MLSVNVLSKENIIYKVYEDGTNKPIADLSGFDELIDITIDRDGLVWALTRDDREMTNLHCITLDRNEVAFENTNFKKIRKRGGRFLALNESGELVRISEEGISSKPLMDKACTDFSLGHDGKVWFLGEELRFGGYNIQWFDQSSFRYYTIPPPAAAWKIDVDPEGFAWTINDYGNIWKIHPLGGGNLSHCQVHTSCDRCQYNNDNEAMDLFLDNAGVVWYLRKKNMDVGNSLHYILNKEEKTTGDVFSDIKIKRLVHCDL